MPASKKKTATAAADKDRDKDAAGKTSASASTSAAGAGGAAGGSGSTSSKAGGGGGASKKRRTSANAPAAEVSLAGVRSSPAPSVASPSTKQVGLPGTTTHHPHGAAAAAAAAPVSEAAAAAIAAAKAAGYTLPAGAIPVEPESDEPTSDGDYVGDDDDGTVDTKEAAEDVRAESATCQWNNCGKMFYHLEPLIEHIHDDHLSSNQNRFFVCAWTGCTRGAKVQMSRFSLMSHLRSHTGEKPYACPRPECDKSFARSDALSKHLKQYHHIQPIPNRRTAASAKKNKARAGAADDDDDGEGGGGAGGGGGGGGGGGDGAEEESVAHTTGAPGNLSVAGKGNATMEAPASKLSSEQAARIRSDYDTLTHGLGIGTSSHPVGAVETAAAAANQTPFSWGKGIPPHHELLAGFHYVDGKEPPLREALSAQDYADLEDEVVLARAREMRKRARDSAAARRRVLPHGAGSSAEAAMSAEAELEWELLQSDEASSDEEESGPAGGPPAAGNATAEDEAEGRASKRARLSATPSTPAAGTPVRNPVLNAAALISNSRASTSAANGASSGSGVGAQTNGKSSRGGNDAAQSQAQAADKAALARMQKKYLIAKAKAAYLEKERVQLEHEYELVRAEAIREKAQSAEVLGRVLVAELGPDVEAIFSPQTSPAASPLAL